MILLPSLKKFSSVIPALSLLLLSLLTSAAFGAAPFETIRRDISTAAGISWQFQPEGGAAQAITVPGGGWRAQGLTCDAGTYRATIPIPQSAKGQVVRAGLRRRQLRRQRLRRAGRGAPDSGGGAHQRLGALHR